MKIPEKINFLLIEDAKIITNLIAMYVLMKVSKIKRLIERL